MNYAHSFQIVNEDLPGTLVPAAERFLLAMEETWKTAVAETSVPSGNLNEITVAIPFDSLAEWNDIRSRIQQTYGVGEVQIDSLSAPFQERLFRSLPRCCLLGSERSAGALMILAPLFFSPQQR